jgi:hypothetical protein
MESSWRRYSRSKTAAFSGNAQAGPTGKPAKSLPLLTTASNGFARFTSAAIDATISRPWMPGS